MIETTESLIPRAKQEDGLRAAIIGPEPESLDELGRLLATLGAEVSARIEDRGRKVNPATFVGKGKLEELKSSSEAASADFVVIDVELSPNQLRNVEKAIGLPVLDRPGVIIEIFSRHARTREAKTQVELARLQYLLPRLAHFWTHFERQRGGIGLKGMGEKQIEVDRRLVKKRMQALRERLGAIERERGVQRAGRKEILKVAVVGYTNAGKSTLLNALTQSALRAEDKLFATLDANVRALDPDSHPPIVAIDTVGFISRLPPALIASFRSTLEEISEADLLLHVVDASAAGAKEQMATTERILADLGVDSKPRLVVLNKFDRVPAGGARNEARLLSPGALCVSAIDPKDVALVRSRVLEFFRKGLELWEVLLPYAESRTEAQLFQHGSVESVRHLEKGTFYRVRIDGGWARKLGLEQFRL